MRVNIFQDGKVCRNVPGTILSRKDKRIFIEFVISDFSEESGFKPVTMKRWFKRKYREQGGVYECIGMNYWYYARCQDKIYGDYPKLVESGLDN
jgi:hypothetical protein